MNAVVALLAHGISSKDAFMTIALSTFAFSKEKETSGSAYFRFDTQGNFIFHIG